MKLTEIKTADGVSIADLAPGTHLHFRRQTNNEIPRADWGGFTGLSWYEGTGWFVRCGGRDLPAGDAYFRKGSLLAALAREFHEAGMRMMQEAATADLPRAALEQDGPADPV